MSAAAPRARTERGLERGLTRVTPSAGLARRLAACAWGLAALAPSPARASSFELFGLGAAGVAEAGARVALATDGTAAFYNPGGLAHGRGVTTTLTTLVASSSLHAGASAQRFVEPVGFSLAADATVPLAGALRDRVRLAFAGHLPASSALRVVATGPSEPAFPFYQNRAERLVLRPALAVRLPFGLGLGAAVNVLGGVDAQASLAPGPTLASEPRIDIVAQTVATVDVGLRLELERVRFGAVFRPKFGVPAKVTTTANVGGVPLEVGVVVREALFDPDTFVLAGSLDEGPLTVGVDASYAAWSAYRGPLVDVRAGLPGVNLRSPPRLDRFKDTVGLRVGASVTLPVSRKSELSARAGVGAESSMLARPEASLADGAKLTLGAGLSASVRDGLPRALRLGLAGQAQLVEPSAPSRALPRGAGGAVTVLAVDVGVEL